MHNRKWIGDEGELVDTEKGLVIITNEPRSPVCDTRFMKCGVCLMEKATRRTPSTSKEVRVKPEMLLKQGDIDPG